MRFKTKCMSDIAICHYKLKEYTKAIEITDEVTNNSLTIQILNLQNNNFDAFFIKAKALKYLERYKEAFASVKAVSFNSLI